MRMSNPLGLQAKKNALGNLMQAGNTLSASSLATPTQHALGGAAFKNPDTVGLSIGTTNLDKAKIDPDYVRRNRFGISKLFSTPPTA